MVGRTCLLASLLALLTCNSALAAVRFASPGGVASSACSQQAPCDFATAVQGAAGGDEVIVEPGTYSIGPATVTDSAAILLHGEPGGARPVLVSSALGVPALRIANASSTVSWLELDASTGSALELDGGHAEELVATGSGIPGGACTIDGGTLRDSICVASGDGAPAVLSTDAVATLRNVTAEATRTDGVGVHATTSGASGSEQLSLINVIAHGATHDIVADASLGGSSAVTVTHSNYITALASAPATISDDGTKQSAPPVFADTSYHESSASPTVGHGLTDPSNGEFDLDGNARVVNGLTDIGADELDLPPVATTDSAVPIHPVGATLRGVVNPGGLPTTVTFQYGTTSHYGAHTAAQQLGPVGFDVPISMEAELRPGTLYHFRVVASNAKGRSRGLDQVLATPRLRLTGVSQASPSWRAETGTVFSFRLNDNVPVLLSFSRVFAGRERGGECRRAARKGARCTIPVPVATRHIRGFDGLNTVSFRGRLAGNPLPPGSYTVTITATADGAKTRAYTLAFRIVA